MFSREESVDGRALDGGKGLSCGKHNAPLHGTGHKRDGHSACLSVLILAVGAACEGSVTRSLIKLAFLPRGGISFMAIVGEVECQSLYSQLAVQRCLASHLKRRAWT